MIKKKQYDGPACGRLILTSARWTGVLHALMTKVLPSIQEWQSRPLDRVYPVVFLDGVVYKVRKNAKIVNKCFYSVLGVTMDGRKEILGM